MKQDSVDHDAVALKLRQLRAEAHQLAKLIKTDEQRAIEGAQRRQRYVDRYRTDADFKTRENQRTNSVKMKRYRADAQLRAQINERRRAAYARKKAAEDLSMVDGEASS
ncbi:hypothetical protein WJX72_012377 [[Myrmecia] bisecta]|uniref:Uncharacterized protein n=1 Tax=[Myrmecia] bisecta TaxID=41462 RepID=A0AAW1Q7Y1_9CHLO